MFNVVKVAVRWILRRAWCNLQQESFEGGLSRVEEVKDRGSVRAEGERRKTNKCDKIVVTFLDIFPNLKFTRLSCESSFLYCEVFECIQLY